ncbi:Rh-like protein/ammonium transporter [Didymella exigua CBS 183.55]|uniref:Rh-like protein/ammonium transporter n=1 Tax=Didymella exigua CBS 183.55 TaxID=1150837 RepID=A0A6A5RNR8_9PLEO|nr:Rh-like protein/ammonium transporter [Didymella exigua CBS 183.55]KAF1928788.1 Rh-like protein/ammonium transporter [Didymella exigua CBS 183.55]
MGLPTDVLKAWEACDCTDTLFVLVCYVFCWGIVPAVEIAYSGYPIRSNSLAAVIPSILAVIFSFFQLVFQAAVCAIAVGGACERRKILPLNPFIFTRYQTFRSKKSSTRTPSHLVIHRPVNSLCQSLAMISIWGSWLASDAGTTLAFNFESAMALCVTNLCAASGAATWMLYTYVEVGRWSLDSCFMGAISGLIMITLSAGFIDVPSVMGFGIVSALFYRQTLKIKFNNFARRWRWVDRGDTFATHCLGGFLATIGTGCLARKEVSGYDGVTEIAGGVFFDGNVRQLGIQIMEALVGFTWSFVGSFTIYALIDCVPGFKVLAEDK